METHVKFAPATSGSIQWFKDCVNARRFHTEVVSVSPMLAAFILDKNEENRSLKASKIKQYTADMKAGRWSLNGEPIIIADNGELNDGQHRMLALIDAGVTVPLLFVFGVSRESRTTVDQGVARSAGDYLAMNGTPNSTGAASLTRLVIAYENSKGKTLGDVGAVTASQILERVDSDPLIAAAASYATTNANYAKGILSPALIGFSFYVLSKINHDDAIEFLGQVCVGENIKRGDPAFAVRAALVNKTRSARAEKAELVLRGWNAYRLNQSRVLAKSVGGLPDLV